MSVRQSPLLTKYPASVSGGRLRLRGSAVLHPFQRPQTSSSRAPSHRRQPEPQSRDKWTPGLLPWVEGWGDKPEHVVTFPFLSSDDRRSSRTMLPKMGIYVGTFVIHVHVLILRILLCVLASLTHFSISTAIPPLVIAEYNGTARWTAWGTSSHELSTGRL